jgi:nucleotide-binding universal stress UspA family protein
MQPNGKTARVVDLAERQMNDKPILICYDGSPGAARAIKTAAALLCPRRAIVLDVAPLLTAAESLALTYSAMAGGAVAEAHAADAARIAGQGAEIARSSGFDAVARAAGAVPTWEGIVEIADELDASVIVVGSRGLRGLNEALRGSVSHQVAKHTGRPVLIVPPRDKRPAGQTPLPDEVKEET